MAKQVKVRVDVFREKYRLRFSALGKQRSFFTGLEATRANLKVAESIASKIELDCLAGYFDESLESYKLSPVRNVTSRAEPILNETVAATPTKKSRKAYKTTRKQFRLPLTTEQIEAIILALKNNTYLNPHSAYPHSHYADFVETAFLLGLRNAELIGLQVKHCNFQQNTIEISSVLARTGNCSHAKARVRKGTKTGNIRFLPMNDRIKATLLRNCESKGKDDLIFTSVRDRKAIDDRAFQRRVLKPVMKAMGLEDRDLYVARHSFGSRALEKGYSLQAVSYMMGHSNIETTIRNYIHVINKPKELPDL